MNDNMVSAAGLPVTKIFQAEEDFRQLAINSLECKEKVIYYIGVVANLAAVFTEEFDCGFYIPARLERRIRLKLLIPDSTRSRDYRESDEKEKRETRFLRPEMCMDTSFMIYDDTVIFFSDAEEHYALEITAPSVARTMKIMFEDAWRCSA